MGEYHFHPIPTPFPDLLTRRSVRPTFQGHLKPLAIKAELRRLLDITSSTTLHSRTTLPVTIKMFTQGAVFLLMASIALSAPSDSYGPSKHQPSYKEEAKPYQYNYAVKDDYAGTDFGQTEESDGQSVKGSYTVQLPDGRKQTVNYVADHYGGYQAEVTYYGEPQYPHEYGPPVTFKPQSYHHEPAYKPTPSYQPAPSYTPEPSYH